jgi:hypothetical protein
MTTQDLYEISLLRYHGHTPERVEVQGTSVVFVYPESKEVTELLFSYRTDQVSVPAKSFADMIKSTKRMVQETLRSR